MCVRMHAGKGGSPVQLHKGGAQLVLVESPVTIHIELVEDSAKAQLSQRREYGVSSTGCQVVGK